MRLRRLHLRPNCLLFLAILLLVLVYITGLIDRFFEKSFDREFRWPPFVNVRDEVDRQLAGKPPSVAYENDWSKFKAMIMPSHGSCGLIDDAVESVLILVKSSYAHIEKRQLIRRTWGSNQNLGKYSTRTIFIVGLPPVASGRAVISGSLVDEAKEHDDLLVVPFADTYQNNTFKFIAALNLSNAHCDGRASDFTFLVDDDYYVDVGNLLDVLATNSHSVPLYMGWRFDSGPYRFVFNKYHVSLNQYPFDRYPPYITAGAVLMSRHTLQRMYLASWFVRLYQMDDIYAGILAYLIRIEPIHNENFRFWPTTFDENEYRFVVAAHGYEKHEDLKKAFKLL